MFAFPLLALAFGWENSTGLRFDISDCVKFGGKKSVKNIWDQTMKVIKMNEQVFKNLF